MTRNSKAIVGILLILSGCNSTNGIEVTRPSETLSIRSSVSEDRFAGSMAGVVRAYALDENGKPSEIQNAVCKLSSRELSGRVVTPQPVQYPMFLQGSRFSQRGKPSKLKVNCTAGKLKGSSVFEPITANLSRGGRSANVYDSSTGQSVAVTIIAPISGKTMSSTYPWRYDATLRVDLQ